jgi:hypothetical protein
MQGVGRAGVRAMTEASAGGYARTVRADANRLVKARRLARWCWRYGFGPEDVLAWLGRSGGWSRGGGEPAGRSHRHGGGGRLLNAWPGGRQHPGVHGATGPDRGTTRLDAGRRVGRRAYVDRSRRYPVTAGIGSVALTWMHFVLPVAW